MMIATLNCRDSNFQSDVTGVISSYFIFFKIRSFFYNNYKSILTVCNTVVSLNHVCNNESLYLKGKL